MIAIISEACDGAFTAKKRTKLQHFIIIIAINKNVSLIVDGNCVKGYDN